MVEILPRSAWTTRAPEGSRSLTPSLVENTAFHWPGMAKAINAIGEVGKVRIASALRGWQRYHMDGRGWSDIAYQMAVDQAGRIWTLRGINIRSGANGNGDTNTRFGAILLILGPGEQPSAEMILASRALLVIYRRRYSRMPIKPTWHGAIRQGGGTACPGPAAIAAIKAGKFNAGSTTPTTPPTTTPPPVKDWFDMATKADLEAALREIVPSIIEDELNKQDRQLWIEGTGKSQVIVPLQQIKKALDGLPEATVKELMGTQIVDMAKPQPEPTPENPNPDRPTIAFSSHVAHGPWRTAKLLSSEDEEAPKA